jgi:hypothetical protein
MNKQLIAIVVLVVVLGGGFAWAQQAVEQSPGYFPLEDLALFAEGGVEVEVDLKGPMIQMMAAAAAEEEPEFGELASQLQRIRVRVGTLRGDDKTGVGAEFDRAIRQLEAAGWEPMVRVDEEDEFVRVFVKQGTERIQGLTVLVNDDFEEGILVNIVGDLDPQLVGRMIGSLDSLPDLDELGIDISQGD